MMLHVTDNPWCTVYINHGKSGHGVCQMEENDQTRCRDSKSIELCCVSKSVQMEFK